jgi:hypothetical protein
MGRLWLEMAHGPMVGLKTWGLEGQTSAPILSVPQESTYMYLQLCTCSWLAWEASSTDDTAVTYQVVYRATTFKALDVFII